MLSAAIEPMPGWSPAVAPLLWHVDELTRPAGRGRAGARLELPALPALTAEEVFDRVVAAAREAGLPVGAPDAEVVLGPPRPPDRLDRRCAADLARPFGPGGRGRLRVRLYPDAGPAGHLLVAAPLAVADGPALRRLLYQALPECAPPGYRANGRWAGEGQSLRAYWRERLAGAGQPVAWPGALSRPGGWRLHRPVHRTGLPPGLAAPLVAAARRAGTSPVVALVAALRVLLARHTGQDDLLLGLRTGTGPIEPLGDLLVLRNELGAAPAPGFAAVLAREAAGHAEAWRHRCSFADLVAAARPGWGPDTFPLVQVVVTDATGPERMVAEHDTLPFDLELQVGCDAGGYRLTWLRHAALPLGDALADRFPVLLADALARPDEPLHRLDTLTGSDRQLLRSTGADRPGAGPDPGHTLAGLVGEWVERTPDAVAVRDGQQVRTYAGLDRTATAVAARLAALGPAPETRVGVLLQRTADLPAVLLGVARAGCAWVPLDPEHPAERLGWMLRDAGVAVLLADRERADLDLDPAVRVVRLDAPLTGALLTDPPPAALPPADPDRLACVLYTSGSSGRPKGVALAHRGLANCVLATRTLMGCRPGQRLLAVTTISFDIAVLELFVMLTGGGETVVVTAAEARDGEALLAAVRRWRPAYLQATPLTWQMLLSCGWEGDPELTVSCGGDVVGPGLAARLRACTKAFWHTYGPTEASMYTVTTELPAGPQPGPLPIGVPLPGTWAGVLDGWSRPVPPGAVGELCIGGAGVARGYVGQPGLTASRFVPDPQRPGGRLYRTGDLARLRPDGRLELLGRDDRQVKIRGHRIEPEEIEHVLAAHPGVALAAVHVDGAADQRRILAFLQLTADRPGPQAVNAVAAYARQRLPQHMIPARYAVLDRMPVNGHGKLDRRALAALRPPAPSSPAPSSPAPPSDGVADTVANAWRWVLGREPEPEAGLVAQGADAAEIGEAVRLLNQRCGVDLPLAAVHESPTVSAYAARIRRARLAAGPGRAPVAWLRRGGALPPVAVFTAGPCGRLAVALGPDRPLAVCRVTGPADDSVVAAFAAAVAGAPGPVRPVLVGDPDGAAVALAVADLLRDRAGLEVPVLVVAPWRLPAGLSGQGGPVLYVRTADDDPYADAWRAAGARVGVAAVPAGRDGPAALFDGAGAPRLAGLVAGVG